MIFLYTDYKSKNFVKVVCPSINIPYYEKTIYILFISAVSCLKIN